MALCLPIGCLKTYVGFVSFITIAIGVLICIASGWMMNSGHEFSSELNASVKKGVLAALIFGVLLIFVGVLGWLGEKYQSKMLLLVFQILVISFLVIFLILGLVAYIGGTYYDPTQVAEEAKCREIFQPLQEVDNVTKKVYQTYFCKPSCPCNYTGTPQEGQKVSPTGPIRVQACPDFNTSGINLDLANAWMAVEIGLNCSGICTKSPWFLFSNVNIGVPQKSCAMALADVISKFGKKVGQVLIGFSIFMLVNAIAICCLCLHPEKEKEGEHLTEEKN